MGKYSRKTQISYFLSRKKQIAEDRRVSMLWINKLVKKQVEKQMGELESLLDHKFDTLREEIIAQLQEHLDKGIVEETSDGLPLVNSMDQELSAVLRWLMTKANEEENKDINELLHDKAYIFTDQLATKYKLEVTFHLLKCSSYSNINDSKGSSVSSEANASSQPDIYVPEGNSSYWSNNTAARSTIHLEKELEEEENTRDPFPQFLSARIRREEEMISVDEIKTDQTLLIGRQLKESIDMQTRRGNVKPGQTKTEQYTKEGSTFNKIKTCLSDIFNPQRHSGWERFEDED